MTPVDRILSALSDHNCDPKAGGKGWSALCPAHEDRRASLSIGEGEDGRVLVRCHAGCKFDAICAALGLRAGDLMRTAEKLPSPGKTKSSDKPRIVAEYDYRDEAGNVLFQAVRYEPKDFRQRKPKGKGGWDANVKDVRRIPYQLDKISRADIEQVVFVVEGEKDVLSLGRLGGLATCNAGGAGKWKPEHSDCLRGRNVVVLPDNDEPGRKHGQQVAASLQGKATSVKVIELPGLPPKGDVSDWIEAGGTIEKLMALVGASPDWKPADAAANDIEIEAENKNVSTSIDCDFEKTENALATTFIDNYGIDLRFVVEWKKWIVWNGKYWSIDLAGVQALRLARKFAESLWIKLLEAAKNPSVGRDELSSLRSFIKGANKQHVIESILNLAKSDARVAISFEELNQQHLLLNCQNGTVDLETGTLEPHSRSHLITQICTVNYDASAGCPKWLETLELICGHDGELVDYLQRLLGYSVSANAGEALLPIVYGSGCNGKSTVWNCVVELLGTYGTLANDTLLLGDKNTHPTEKADLYGQRFVAISEPERSAALKEARVKELTGDKFIKARRMFENLWSFRRSHTFWLSTNHLPRIQGTDEGIWRRVKLIPFVVDLRTKVTPIPNYSEWLVKTEGAGILAWLVQGFIKWKAQGLTEPKVVKDATMTYRQDSDSLGEFISEYCVVDSGAVVSANDLFDCYEKKYGGKWSKTGFGRAMTERFEKQKPKSGPYRDKTIYLGLKLHDDDFGTISKNLNEQVENQQWDQLGSLDLKFTIDVPKPIEGPDKPVPTSPKPEFLTENPTGPECLECGNPTYENLDGTYDCPRCDRLYQAANLIQGVVANG